MGLISSLVENSQEYRQLKEQYQELVRRTAHIRDVEESLQQTRQNFANLQREHNELVRRTAHILDAEESLRQTRQMLANLQQEYNLTLARHNELKALIMRMEQDEDLIQCGIYKPAYSFAFSTEYKLKLDNVRDLQKQKVKDKAAVRMDGSLPKAESQRLAKLVLKAFNGECDALASDITWKNIDKTLDQVGREAQAINKLVQDSGIEIDPSYVNLKLSEMRLIHEFQERKQAELEEQRAVRERMREEEKARLEYEKAMREATQEQERFQKALAEAESKLAGAHGAELDRLNETIVLLAKRLDEAKEKGLRAQSMAELTKSGHVYVISNVGSFGDKMYKIGMTRRLDPTERIDELGDASVPFRFDIHAIIYSKDAPALESKLHEHFRSRQVNLVNDRKEFFYATLGEIEQAVRSFHGQIEFMSAAQAKEYRETCALRNERKTQDQTSASSASATSRAPIS